MPKANPKNKLDLKPKSPKGEQARKRLKAAALSLLAKKDYRSLKVTDITYEASMATGLFYHYFSDLKSLIEEVLTEYVAEIYQAEKIEKNVPKGDWYQRIFVYHLKVAESYANNPGLMASLLQYADDDKGFANSLRQAYIDQLKWLVELMPKLFPEAKQSEQESLLFVYSLAAGSEVLLRDIYINQLAELTETNPSVVDIAELLSTMFYRGLFLQNPDNQHIKRNQFISHLKR